MFDINKYLRRTHPDDSIDLQKEDFENSKQLVECVNNDGILNNVKYNISTGMVVTNNDDGLTIELE